MRSSSLLAALVVLLLLCALVVVALAHEGPIKALPHSVMRSGISAGDSVSDSLAPRGYAYFCSSSGVEIPDADPTGVSDIIGSVQSFTVRDLNVYISTTHTWVGDLIYTLEHLDTGTSVTIIDRPGVPATSVGCSGNNIDATLDDEVGSPVEDECAETVPTILGSFYPNNPLIAFDGENVSGDWQLAVSDNAGADTGTLNTWCLEATDCVQIAWADFTFTPPSPQVGEQVSFTAFSGPDDTTGPIDYIWDFGDGFGDVGPMVSHVYGSVQTFVVTLTVQNPCNSLDVAKPVAVGSLPQNDLGDAPDSTNHAGAGMIAYPPAVAAHFPTVFDPATGLPQGPNHLDTGGDSWLGASWSGERDADLLPDADGITNIAPAIGPANRDRLDDGVVLPLVLPHCSLAVLTYTVTVAPGAPTTARFVNVWFDWNRNGDWEDQLTCPGPLTTDEWAVQDHVIAVGPGTHTLVTPYLLPYNPDPDAPLWMRITLSERPAPVNPSTTRADGRGPSSGYDYGETEDYYLGKRYTYLPLVLRNP